MQFLAFLFAFLTLGCSKNTHTPETHLLHTNTWELTQLGDITLTNNLKAPTIAFTNGHSGKVNGSGSCNQYFSTFDTKGDALTLNGIGSTEMACENIALETQYFDWLTKSQTYTITADGFLHIQCAQGKLIFKPAK